MVITSKKGQFKIQQMAFMIVGLLIFFVLVALAFLAWQYRSIQNNYEDLQQELAITSLKTIAGMPELACSESKELCLDEDKLEVMIKEKGYNIWPVASINVTKIYPADKFVKCPGQECNVYEIYNSGQKNMQMVSTYVSICKKIKETSFYDKYEIGKLIVGVKLIE